MSVILLVITCYLVVELSPLCSICCYSYMFLWYSKDTTPMLTTCGKKGVIFAVTTLCAGHVGGMVTTNNCFTSFFY